MVPVLGFFIRVEFISRPLYLISDLSCRELQNCKSGTVGIPYLNKVS
jgi:hypothetical protein